MNAWSRGTDFFLPEVLHADPEAQRRGRLVVQMSLALAAVFATAVVLRGLLAPIAPPALLGGASAAAFFAAVPEWLRRTGRLQTISRTLVAVFTLTLFFIAFFVGGTHASILYSVPIIPLLAIFLLGERGGYVSTAAIIVLWAGLLIADANSLVPTHLPARPVMMFAMLITVLQGVALAVLYERRRLAGDELNRLLLKESRTLNRALAGKNAELEQFSRMVSHDLKSPLLTVDGFLELLLLDLKEGNVDRVEKDVRNIREATEKMRRMIEDLLKLARLETGSQPYGVIDLDRLVADVAELVGGRLRRGGVELVIAPNFPNVSGRSPQIRAVFQNLLDNAAKYAAIQTDADIKPRVEVGWFQDAECEAPIFFVADNGPGIAPENHDRVFLVFEKLDAAETEGTGIGLAIVRRVIDLHDGRVWIDPEASGTKVCFTLGLSPIESANGPQPIETSA